MASPEGIKVSSQNNEDSNDPEGNNGNGDGASDRLEKIVERKRFEEVLAKLYFGNTEEQAEMIFNM
jgi:hypothetical protein